MAFISVPEERFKTDLLKTRIGFFKNDPELAGVSVLSRLPDIDTWLKLPNIVIARVGKEKWGLSRLSWYHWDSKRSTLDSPNEVWQLKGYTLNAMRQINIMTKTIWEMDRISAIVERKLKQPEILANDWAGIQKWTVIPLLDFEKSTSEEGSPTDLEIRFRPWDDIEGLEIQAFDKELHQYAITVNFWINYLKEYNYPQIHEIDTTINDESIIVK